MGLIKTRFCPSPTGFMHIGNVRVALLSALLAKSKNGQFLLRIEDTDEVRSAVEYTEKLIEGLKWLGIRWQEGPDIDKGNGPYFQSQRKNIYDKYYKQLEEANIAYPCFCSQTTLAVERKCQLDSGHPPRYSGTCSTLTKEQIEQKIKEGIKPTLRFKVPKNKTIEFVDLVKGAQKFNSNDFGDFIIRRADGTSQFVFCNAVDDSLMNVTHVLRGEDHVANTVNQILILEALGLTIPSYGHISLILGFDGAPLSKRHGSFSIVDMQKEGFLPGAIINYLARLGNHYEDNSFMSFDELALKFKLENLSQSPAKFDKFQLRYWQKLAISHSDENTLWEWMGNDVHHLVPKEAKSIFIKTVSSNILLPQEALHFAKIFFEQLEITDPEKIAILKNAGVSFYDIALKAMDQFGNDYPQVISELKNKLNIQGKSLFLPLRVALTGELHGSELVHVFELLGKDEIKKRLEAAREK